MIIYSPATKEHQTNQNRRDCRYERSIEVGFGMRDVPKQRKSSKSSAIDRYKRSFQLHEAIALGYTRGEGKNIIESRANTMRKMLDGMEKNLP
jgi:hypothetical protein